ncbi:MAG: TSUP family transporter, partial [Candidatus Thermoplasmatota archaeon]|nr:TSUP family transporter [Candidatus Thermoplasmatota archaeon]
MEFLLVLILVFITGFLFAPLGLGGGMLFVPILHYIAGWPLNTSTLVVSLLLTCCTSSGSGFIHYRQGLMQINHIRKGAPSALLGAIIGSLIVYLLRDELDPVFKTLAMAIVFWAIIKTW